MSAAPQPDPAQWSVRQISGSCYCLSTFYCWGSVIVCPLIYQREPCPRGAACCGSEEPSLVSSAHATHFLARSPLAYCNGKVIVCPGVRLMCEMFCPPYSSDPVLVK